MNAEPQKTEQGKSRAAARLSPKALLKRAFKAVMHNWGWKLAALLLALCLWAGLITQDPTLTRERTFNDVSVSVVGNDTLRRNGMIVLSGLEDEALVARLRADVPQREYNTVNISSYYPRVDLSRVSDTGEQTLRILTTSTTTYGTVQSVLPDSIKVVVDEYITNYRVPVTVNIVGDYPTGFYGPSPTADPSVVAVSGPKSIVSRITRVCVDFDVSKLAAKEGLSRNALGIRFTDAQGEPVESELLEVTSAEVLLRTVIVQQQLYPSKMVPVSSLELTTGRPADGYRVTGVEVSPSFVLIAGAGDGLSAVESVSALTSVELADKSESFSVESRLVKPAEASYMNADVVTLTVGIEPVSVTRTFDSVKLSVIGASSGQKKSLDTKSVALHLTGPQNEIEALRSSDISAYVDVRGTDGAGEYELPVQVRVEGVDMADFSYTLSLDFVKVTLGEQ